MVVPVGVSLSVILFLTIVAIIIMVCLMEHTLNVLKVFLKFFFSVFTTKRNVRIRYIATGHIKCILLVCSFINLSSVFSKTRNFRQSKLICRCIYRWFKRLSLC